uniref:Uncharacterized protein n=1 Tax=Tanacetum cinerariifolium TaxID=118510 RepID=A0A6L2K660_TANCI|nr:hypothetical protein [Tanacetum cinerariifolium]
MSSSKLIICFIAIALLPLCFVFAAADEDLSPLVVEGMSCYARALIEIQADAELKDTIVVAMPKLTGEGFHTCIVHVEYKRKPPRYACCKASRGVLVGSKEGFKPTKEYKPVAKKPTANASGNKKKSVEPTKEVSSNQFDLLNLVVNDEELGTNGGDSNFEKLIINGKATLMDDDGKPLKKVDYLGDHDSDDKVYLVDNDMAHSMATETVGFSAQSLLEQWRDSYENGDYDEDPYDVDMYKGHDLPDKIQDICDNLDIRVRGRKNKYFIISCVV